MSDFPNSIYSPRTKENRAGVVYDAAKKTVGFAEDVVYLDGEVVAIETELGATPKNTSASVAERLKGIRSLSDSDSDVVNIKAGKVGIGTAAPGKLVHAVGTGIQYSRVDVVVENTALDGKTGLNLKNDARTYALFVNGADGNKFYFRDETAGTNFFKVEPGAPTDTLVLRNNGRIGVSTSNPSAFFDINSDILRLRTSKTPASAGDTGNAGDICWDSNYIYVCVATNTWKRVAIATW